MSVYHLDDHKDSHCLTNRYICEEKIKKSREMCLKGYKQQESQMAYGTADYALSTVLV